MARSDFVARVKSILYGQGLGEKPSIRRCAASGNVSVSGSIVTFDLLAGEGANVKPGHVLSFVSENDDTKAYVFYVTGMSTDQVTAVNGYHGAPAIANASADLDAGILEHQPLRTEYEIHQAVDTVFDSLLWPEAYDFDTGTVTPDLTHGQVEVPAAVRWIDSAWQVRQGEAVKIPFALFKNLETGTVSSTGNLATFDAIDGTTVYYTYASKLVIGDETNDEALVWMVATGAAAILLGASVSDTVQERSKKDSQDRRDPSATLWRDFLTLRQQYSHEDSRDVVELLVERSF